MKRIIGCLNILRLKWNGFIAIIMTVVLAWLGFVIFDNWQYISENLLIVFDYSIYFFILMGTFILLMALYIVSCLFYILLLIFFIGCMLICIGLFILLLGVCLMIIYAIGYLAVYILSRIILYTCIGITKIIDKVLNSDTLCNYVDKFDVDSIKFWILLVFAIKMLIILYILEKIIELITGETQD